MLHFSSLENVSLAGAWLTIGTFDGVHLGHQKIIHALTAGARTEGLPAVVLTFFPHPAVVLRDLSGMIYLSTPEERAARLGELGVDVVVTYPFDRQVAILSAREFIGAIHQRIHFSQLLIGYDFALGRGREGNSLVLSQLGQEFGYQLTVVEPLAHATGIVSSSQIRSALSSGEVVTAARLLGQPYQINGLVVHGDGRGRTIGIPTANLEPWPQKYLPKAGVYACWAEVDGRRWGAVTNLGFRPTFDNQPPEPRLEAHFLDYRGDLYGKSVRLAFIQRQRDEQRFPSIPALVEQIQHDISRSREILAALPHLGQS